MGYFSNGTEGMMYEEEYCSKCAHQPDIDNGLDCAVLEAHAIYNYKECNNPDSILHILIPRNDDDCYNGKCKMFIYSHVPKEQGILL